MRLPAAVAAVPLIIGVLLGLAVWEQAGSALAVAAAGAALVSLTAALAAFGSEDGRVCVVAVVAGVACAGVSLGTSAGLGAYRPSLLQWFERASPDAVTLSGRLRDDAAPGSYGPSLTVDVDAVVVREGGRQEGRRCVEGGVRLTVSGRLASEQSGEWRAGRRVRAVAVLRPPAYYANPGVADDRRALARRGIVLVGSVKSAALVEVVARGSASNEAAASARAWVRRTLARHVGGWSPRSAAIAAAILIGDRSGLDPEESRRLQEAGTYHVIAISGGNIAILTAVVLGVVRVLAVPARTGGALTICLLLFYGRITGPSPSVDRAIAAAVLYLAARILDHRGPALNLLAIAAALGVAASPITLLDAGFVLSFGATFGILVGADALTWVPPTGRRRLRRVLHAVAGLLAATLAAEAVLGPIGAVLFSRVTFAGLILNFAAIPLMSVVQASALMTLLMASVADPLAALAGRVTHLASSALVDSARLVDVVPILSRDVIPPAWWLVGLYYIALAWAVRRGRTSRAAWSVTALAAVAIVAGSPRTAHEAVAAPAAATLRIVFLDVGQGDATLVVLPGGNALLVDTGGAGAAWPQDADANPSAFDIGARVVGPALRALGIRRIDLLVATHGDPDHIGGGPSLIRAFEPRQVWEGVPVPPHPGLGLLRAAADAAGATWRTVQAGDVERHGPVTIRVLHPPRPDWERQRVRNEDSIALDIRMGKVSVILPGDIGREGEAAVRPLLSPAPLVVLKAPHHGSATSSTSAFIGALNPRIVVFSAGRNNRFGHPSPPVVARYVAMGTTMFSTAADGAVVMDTDGEVVQLTGWKGRVVKMRARW